MKSQQMLEHQEVDENGNFEHQKDTGQPDAGLISELRSRLAQEMAGPEWVPVTLKSPGGFNSTELVDLENHHGDRIGQSDGMSSRMMNEDDDDDVNSLVNGITLSKEDQDQDQDHHDHHDDKLKRPYSEYHFNELMDESNPWPCWRYLIHTHKRLDECLKLMKTCLEWRHKNQVDPCMYNEQMVKEFWHMTPIVRCGKDHSGNNVYCIVGRHYRKPDQMLKPIIRRFVCNILFEWDRRNSRTNQKLTLIFDVTNTGYQNMDLDYMAWMVSIRDYLPARIANVYVIGIPLLIRPFVRLIIGWLPDNFRNIVQCGTWDELIRANMDEHEIPMELGGSRPDERLAPPEAPWMAESSFYEDPAKCRAVEWCIGFSCDEETRARRRQKQIEFELSQGQQ